MQDFQDTAKFVKEDERTAVVQRLSANNQFSARPAGLEHEFKFRYMLDAILDVKV